MMQVYEVSGTEGSRFDGASIDPTCYSAAFDAAANAPTITTAGTCTTGGLSTGVLVAIVAGGVVVLVVAVGAIAWCMNEGRKGKHIANRKQQHGPVSASMQP